MKKTNTWVPGYYRTEVQPRLPEILKLAGGACLVYHLPGILESGSALNRAFGRLNHHQMFAFKATPEPFIIKTLYERLGFGADCSSSAEVLMSRALGLPGKKIMFTANRVEPHEFDIATANSGSIINFDDITAPNNIHKFPELVCFRTNPGKKRTGNSIIGNPYDAKYGITYKQILDAYAKARRRGAKRFGIHTMVVSNTKKSKEIIETVREMLFLAELLFVRLGIKVEFVNIGGGFGIPYHPDDPELDLVWIGKQAVRLFSEFDKKYGFEPMLLTECGRFVTGPHGFLVNPVITVEKKYQYFIGVSAAMTGCPRPAFYGAHHHMEVYDWEGNLLRGRTRPYHVAGKKCENWDRLTPNGKPRRLPMSVKVGDIHVTFNCGAHSTAMADNYNWQLRLPAFLIDMKGRIIQIRRRETYADLFRTIMPIPGVTFPQ